jgi:hypothetical protein
MADIDTGSLFIVIIAIHLLLGAKVAVYFLAICILRWKELVNYASQPDSLPIPQIVYTTQEIMLIAVSRLLFLLFFILFFLLQIYNLFSTTCMARC